MLCLSEGLFWICEKLYDNYRYGPAFVNICLLVLCYEDQTPSTKIEGFVMMSYHVKDSTKIQGSLRKRQLSCPSTSSISPYTMTKIQVEGHREVQTSRRQQTKMRRYNYSTKAWAKKLLAFSMFTCVILSAGAMLIFSVL